MIYKMSQSIYNDGTKIRMMMTYIGQDPSLDLQ